MLANKASLETKSLLVRGVFNIALKFSQAASLLDESIAFPYDFASEWYIKYKREDKAWMYETASSVSPDMELAVKKSTILAKSKLADRINGKMNNQTTIDKVEKYIDENSSTTGSAEDTIVNIIGDTLVKDYIVDKVEIFYTHHKSYRAYVRVKVSKANVASVIEEIREDKKLAQNTNSKSHNLRTKVKEVLANID